MSNKEISLKHALSQQIDNSKGHARRNYRWAYGFTLAGAAASALATLIIAFGESENLKEITAIIAALPAAAMLIESRLRLEERSRWHWHKTKKLQALERSLQYEGIADEEISKKWSDLEIELEEGWIGLNREV